MRRPLFRADIIRASEAQVDVVTGILQQATDWLAARGMHHWDDFYTPERVRRYSLERELYVLRLNRMAVGTITLSSIDDDEEWGFKRQAIYAYGLAVLPQYHRRGFGSFLMSFSEEIAKLRGLEAVRFDSLESFAELHDFYTKRDYRVVGKAQRRFSYLQYEKLLDQVENVADD